MEDLTDRTSTIRNQIERITKDKKIGFRTLTINISPNKTSYGVQKLAPLKKIFQILGQSTLTRFYSLHTFVLPKLNSMPLRRIATIHVFNRPNVEWVSRGGSHQFEPDYP